MASCSRQLEKTQSLDADLIEKGKVIQNMVEVTTKQGLALRKLEDEGKTEEAAALAIEVKALKAKYDAAAIDYRAQLPQGNQQQQTLRVCETCSCKLSILDNDVRLADPERAGATNPAVMAAVAAAAVVETERDELKNVDSLSSRRCDGTTASSAASTALRERPRKAVRVTRNI